MTSKRNLEMVSEQDNYISWLFGKIRPYLGQEILEVGAGLGVFTRLLEEDDRNVMAIDKNLYGKKYCDSEISRADITSEPAGLKSRFDTVVCMNVLEHIDDDLGALTNMHACLADKGTLLLIVPAFQFAYGPVDRSNEHHRRYSRNSIRSRVRDAGFRIKRIEYMNMLGLLGWLYQNRILRSGVHRQGDLRRFNWLCPVLSRLERLGPPPFGLNLFIVAEK